MRIKIVKANRLTGEARVAYYKAVLRETINDERAFIRKMRPLFKIQEQIVLGNLEALKGKAFNYLKKINWSDVLFNEDEQAQVFIKFEKPLMLGLLEKAGKRVSALLGDPAFTPLNDRVDKFLKKRTDDFSEVPRTTAKKIRESLAEGAAAGESIPKLQDRVSGIFSDLNGYRSEAIARTEVGAATNFGHWEAYQQSEAVDEMEWVATMDDRVRDTHLEADGQTIKKDQKFDVGGESLEYPRDPSGSPENTINCRCTTIPVIK